MNWKYIIYTCFIMFPPCADVKQKTNDVCLDAFRDWTKLYSNKYIYIHWTLYMHLIFG